MNVSAVVGFNISPPVRCHEFILFCPSAALTAFNQRSHVTCWIAAWGIFFFSQKALFHWFWSISCPKREKPADWWNVRGEVWLKILLIIVICWCLKGSGRVWVLQERSKGQRARGLLGNKVQQSCDLSNSPEKLRWLTPNVMRGCFTVVLLLLHC